MSRLVDRVCPPGRKVIAIKVNLCDYRRAETGVTSDPAVVDALLTALRRLYPQGEICLYENDATSTVVAQMWTYLGIRRVADKHDARCVSLSDTTWEEVQIPGRRHVVIEVP